MSDFRTKDAKFVVKMPQCWDDSRLKRCIISFIIPTYNRAPNLELLLKTLAPFLSSCCEIIIVDDGSTDDTETRVAHYLSHNIRYYKIKNSERGVARNYGAQNARGDFLNFFDSDDFPLPNHTSVALTLIKQTPNIKWFHLNYATYRNERVESARSFKGIGEITRSLLDGNCFSCNGVFIQREFFLRNRFSTERNLSGSEDYELWLRLYAQEFPKFTNTVTSIIVDHSERSVKMPANRLFLLRINALLGHIKSEALDSGAFRGRRERIEASVLSYASLHFSTANNRKLLAFKYWIMSLYCHPFGLFKIRTLIIFRNLFLRW